MKFKKMLSLLTAAAMSVSCLAGLSISAGAATASEYIPGTTDSAGTVYSAGDTILDDDNITITVTAAVTVSSTSDSNFLPATYPYNLPFRNGSTGYTDILVTPKVGGTFTATVGINKEKWMYIKENSTSGTEIASEYPSVKGPNTISAELEAGKTYIVYAAGTGAALLKVNFEPEEASETKYTTIYQFGESNGAETINIGEGSTGSVKPTTADAAANAPDIAVDSTNNGKLNNDGRGDTWAQINTNTILTLPDVAAGTTLTFSLYSTTGLTIDGTEYTNGQIYTASTDGDVVMTCTTSGYISTITVYGLAFGTVTEETATASPEPTATVQPVTGAYSNTWYFGKSNNGNTEFALQNTDPYTYTVNGYSLVVDTKTNGGKLNNASRTDQWCQCNGGTTFIIPAYEGMKITWGGYTANESTGFKVDGTLYNEYYIADGTTENVSIIAEGISYISYITVEPVSIYDITGSLTVADSADLAGSSIKFTAANGQEYTAAIAAGNTFSISLPAQTYTAAILNDSYVIPSASASVTVSGTTMTLPVSAATLQTVSGSVANAPKDAYKLTFTSATGSETTINVDGGAASYTAQLYSGTYTVSSESGTLSPISQESFDVADADVVKNLYFPETITPAAKNTLTVGTQSGDDYETITDALTALAAGGQTSPTIILHSGATYQEQVIVNIADTTFKTDGDEKATITWYYGIGYTYYSLGTDGYYDKDRAMTKTGKLTRDPDRWGAVVRVRAANFKAENINFENSFNQYYTEAEVKDGVEPNGCQSITVDRVAQAIKADAKTATERGAAIALDGDNAELYNCSFVGSQDTFYTYKNAYVKNCDITGNTDYIFGGGNVVFDNCNLIWGGYSSDAVGGYITADNPTQGDYYIFRNCTVKNATVEGRTYAGGNLGRDWGGEKAGVYYFNLKDETGKLSYTWTNMGGSVETGKANLHIYDFDPEINKNYNSEGATGANVNGVLSFADAKSLYEGIVSRIGFTPEHLTNAVTTTDVAASDDGTARGVLTTVTAGSSATVSGIKWTVTNGSKINTFSTADVTSRTFPTITGGEATVAIIFNTEDTEATYNVLSQVIE